MYSLKYLKSKPTLCVGQFDNLKTETQTKRVWLSRCGVADGEPYDNKVTIERYNSKTGSWEITEEYQAF